MKTVGKVIAWIFLFCYVGLIIFGIALDSEEGWFLVFYLVLMGVFFALCYASGRKGTKRLNGYLNPSLPAIRTGFLDLSETNVYMSHSLSEFMKENETMICSYVGLNYLVTPADAKKGYIKNNRRQFNRMFDAKKFNLPSVTNKRFEHLKNAYEVWYRGLSIRSMSDTDLDKHVCMRMLQSNIKPIILRNPEKEQDSVYFYVYPELVLAVDQYGRYIKAFTPRCLTAELISDTVVQLRIAGVVWIYNSMNADSCRELAEAVEDYNYTNETNHKLVNTLLDRLEPYAENGRLFAEIRQRYNAGVQSRK